MQKKNYFWVCSTWNLGQMDTYESAEIDYKNPKFPKCAIAVRAFHQILMLKHFALNMVIWGHTGLRFPCHTRVPGAPNEPLTFFSTSHQSRCNTQSQDDSASEELLWQRKGLGTKWPRKLFVVEEKGSGREQAPNHRKWDQDWSQFPHLRHSDPTTKTGRASVTS